MVRHVGIIACSAEGAAECYRTLCAQAEPLLGAHGNPPVSLHMQPLAEYVRHLEAGRADLVGELMLDSARRLQACGADVLICPDNTIHQGLPHVADRMPLPFLHIAEVVAEEAARRGFWRLALTGTVWLTESDVYPQALGKQGIETVLPTKAERTEIGRIIMDELVRGKLEAPAEAFFQHVIGRMAGEDGCDAVVLGCTEIPLLMNDGNSPLPTLDSTRLLALAALRHAVEG